MMLSHLRILSVFGVLSLVFWGGPVSAKEVNGPMSVEELFLYAHSLERGGDYRRSATEYGRLVHFLVNQPDVRFRNREEAFFRHAVVLASAGETDRALQAFALFGEQFPRSRYIDAGLLKMGELYEKADMAEEARRRYRHLVARGGQGATFARLRLAWLALQEEGSVTQARHHVAQIADAEQRFDTPDWDRALEAVVPVAPKNPWAAGALTAVLPGSGHLYLDRPRDALFSFLSNGLMIAGTVQAFDRGLSGLGVALGFIELGWYTGSIFSAVSLTHAHNKRDRDMRLQAVRPFLKPDDEALGLELNLHY